MIRRSTHCLLVLLLAAGNARTSAAQTQALPPTDRAATVVAGNEYDTGPLTRTLFGNGWRDVWATPVVAPVFDMSRFAGGVKPTERGGGNQTISLRFRENNGWREYHFRSVNKDPVSKAMPPAIRGTTVGNVVQDLTSTLYPAGSLMIPTLLDAIGVLHVTPSLYVMPDDPRLGEFRKDFAGMLGTVELSPQEAPNDQPGFAGSTKIINGYDFLDEVAKSRENRLDEREFLAARLVDFIVNDNDRTQDNIRFARYGNKGAYTWRPLPRDRDRAFTDARGWLTAFVIRPAYPKVIAFEPKFSLAGLTFESYKLDRRLLQRLTRDDVREVSLRVQRSLTNATIDNAISQLPPPWRDTSGERLRSVLRARRDAIPAFAMEFYEWLATEVDVYGTDEKESAVITRHDDGRVTVTISGKDDSASVQPFSTRTFLPSETNEVRVFLGDDDDRAVVKGAANSAIAVRIIGGDGDDFLADSAGGHSTRLYDAKGENDFVTQSGTRVSVQEWDPPRSGSGPRLDAPWRPDWGKSTGWGPTFDYGHGAGLIVGFGPRYQSQGFRRLPYKTKASANILLGLANMKPGVSLDIDHKAENSPLSLQLHARATQFEEFRFHGYGNDVDKVDNRLSKIEQNLVAVEPVLAWEIGWRTHENLPNGFGEKTEPMPGLRPLTGMLEAGPVFYWNDPDPRAQSPLNDPALAGSDDLARLGLRLGLSLDRTSGGGVSDRGWTFDGELAGYPPLWDIEQSFSTAAATLATYVPLPGNGTHLAFRAGGELASGGFPVQHAPAIGGRRTVRGYGYQRYRGESAAYGSAELRIPVGTVPLLIKWNAGVFGLADAGRVWFGDRSPGGWHSGFGGGLWFSSLGQTFSVAYAHGEEHRFYLQKGLSF